MSDETKSIRKFDFMKYASRSVKDLDSGDATVFSTDLDERGNKTPMEMLRTFEDTTQLVKECLNKQYRAVFFDQDRMKITKDGTFASRETTRGSRDRDERDRYRKDDDRDRRSRDRRDEDRLDRGLDRDGRDKYDKRDRDYDDKKRRDDRDRRDDRGGDRYSRSRDADRGRYSESSYRRDRDRGV